MAIINTPTGGDEELKSRLKGLTPEQKARLLEILKQDKESNENEQENIDLNPKFFGNKEAILEDLKEKHVKIEKNVEMMGYKGKKVHINLPAVGNFEGFKFDYFVSDEVVNENVFEDRLKGESYSKEEILDILRKFGEYMSEYGIKTDMTQVNVNDYDLRDHYRYVTDLLGLNKVYWLSDEHHAKMKTQSRYNAWYCNAGTCTIHGGISRQRLLLKTK